MRSEHNEPNFGNASPTGVMWHKNRWKNQRGEALLFFRMPAFGMEKKLHVIMCPLHTLQNFKEGFTSTYSTKHVFHSKNMVLN